MRCFMLGENQRQHGHSLLLRRPHSDDRGLPAQQGFGRRTRPDPTRLGRLRPAQPSPARPAHLKLAPLVPKVLAWCASCNTLDGSPSSFGRALVHLKRSRLRVTASVQPSELGGASHARGQIKCNRQLPSLHCPAAAATATTTTSPSGPAGRPALACESN